jgi:hypothetical protein
MKLMSALVFACIASCLSSAQDGNALASLHPIMNVADEPVYESGFSEAGEVDKTIWQNRQGTQWTIAGGVLRGEQSTAEYQAKREHHYGYEPRIKSLNTPPQFIASFSVRFVGGEETSLLPLIEFGHHNVRLHLSKAGTVMLADHEQVQLAKTDAVRLESGRWYHLLAERQADEFVVQIANGPTLYARHKSLAIPVDDTDGLGIAGTRRGTVEIDNVTLWSIKPGAKAKGWAAAAKGLRQGMAAPVVTEKPAKKPKSAKPKGAWVKAFFAKHPAADANGDGVLTVEEAKRFKAKQKD